jgi:cytochrome c
VAALAIFAMAAWSIGVAKAGDAGDAANGKVLFQHRCSVCHSVNPNGGVSVGPDLAGVVGRKSGSVAGYSYSGAMRAAGLVWSPSELNQFLAAPNSLVPGTRMAVHISDAQNRRDLIAYLKSLKAAPH